MQIDQSNYESFLLSYVDGELTAAERREVESWCRLHPEAAAGLELLQQTISVPPPVVFDAKDSLYREEERRVIGFYFRRAAVMLVLLAGAATFWLTRSHRAADNSALLAEQHDSGKTVPATKSRQAIATEKEKNAPENGKPASAAIAATATADIVHGSQPVPEDPVRNAGSAHRPLPSKHAENPRQTEEPAIAGMPVTGDAVKDGQPPATGNADPGEISFPVTTTPAKPENRGRPAVSSITGMPVGGTVPAATLVSTRETKVSPSAVENRSSEETGFYEGSDAVGILPLAKSKNGVSKLFRRLTGTRDRDAEQDGKKVNISVFQFALNR